MIKMHDKSTVLITGCAGLIGSRLAERLKDEFVVLALDVNPLSGDLGEQIRWIDCDLTSDQSVVNALRECHGHCEGHLTSVVHLAAYYDFSGEPSPLYRDLTVNGTERLLEQLEHFVVDQFIFSSTLLVMQSSDDGAPLTEASSVDAEWPYPQSKLAAEHLLTQTYADLPIVILRMAGVYDEDCHSLPLSQQISRIYEKQFEGYFFPGNQQHGQSFVHLDDLMECIRQTITHQKQLAPYEVFLVGEEDVMSYAELQEALGTLIHGKQWPTIRIPKPLAKAGAWIQGSLADEADDEPFIKPWMIDLADQNYPVNIQKARQQLGWTPRHTLRQTLPEMVSRLLKDPQRWYRINGLPLPDELAVEVSSKGTTA
jgi:nucleoside-diphosphate-sugar epimerase